MKIFILFMLCFVSLLSAGLYLSIYIVEIRIFGILFFLISYLQHIVVLLLICSQFLSVIIMTIYIGALMIFFLFVVMLMGNLKGKIFEASYSYLTYILLTILHLFFLAILQDETLVNSFAYTELLSRWFVQESVYHFGFFLFNNFIFELIFIGLAFLVVLILSIRLVL